ncbi:MAG: hypothetical protein OXE55_04935 [Flavobacteriaceae bacterium]|nr:hypothetical protein [Flavobacteriaceae bacterium]
MKRIFILLAAVAVVAAGCKNYDDRFDNLNDQIKTITAQVTTLQGGVASQVAALQTEIGNIRQSIQGDIQTAVAGVSTTLGTNLTNAQTAINEDIAKLQTALNQAAANSLSQEDIDQLKADLAAAQKTALDEAVKGLQDKVTALETALAEAAKNNLSQAAIDELEKRLEAAQKEALDKTLEGLQAELAEIQKAIEDGDAVPSELTNRLDDIEGKLDESISRAGFYKETVEITTNGEWLFVEERLPNVEEFAGDFIIDTEKLSDENIDALIAWVAKIRIINADLTITHDDEDKVIKFGELTIVETLNDGQPHAHYPKLTSVDTIHLNSEDKNNDNEFVTQTVKFPKLEQTVFAGNKIHLPDAEELTLTALSAYEVKTGALDIELDGGKVDLSSLQEIHNGERSESARSLTITDVDEVHLDALTKVDVLTVEKVETLKAPKIKDGDLTIKQDVEKIDVATAEGAHIGTFKLEGEAKDDIEELKVGGDHKKTVIEIKDAGNQLEVVHIHGAKTVVIDDAGGLDELKTARTIVAFTLQDSGLKGDLVLGHQSGKGSVLQILENKDLLTLTADKVNELKALGIKGNHELERISFAALNKGSAQSFGKPNWYDGDAVVIGGTQYDAADRGAGKNYLHKDRNNLKADLIYLEVKGNGADRQAGDISDSSGISELRTFLAHENIKRAIVSYDGVESFRRTGLDSEETVEIESNQDGDDLVLIRKGLTNIGAAGAGQAKRVFYGTIGDRSQPSRILIRVGDNWSRPIALEANSSPNNWVQKITNGTGPDDNITHVSWFSINNIGIKASPGANPKGRVIFEGSVDSDDQTPDDAINDLKPGAFFKLTIGGYSHTVHIKGGTGTKDVKPFSKSNKHAISHLILGATNDSADIIDALVEGFSENTPYDVEFDNNNSWSIEIESYDRQYIAKAIPVKFEYDLLANKANDAEFDLLTGGLNFNNGTPTPANQFFTKSDVNNTPNSIQIELTSGTPGVEASIIGQPKSAAGFPRSQRNDEPPAYISSADASVAFQNGEEAAVNIGSGQAQELLIKGTGTPDYRFYSSLPKAGTAVVKGVGGDKDITNRLAWL